MVVFKNPSPSCFTRAAWKAAKPSPLKVLRIGMMAEPSQSPPWLWVVVVELFVVSRLKLIPMLTVPLEHRHELLAPGLNPYIVIKYIYRLQAGSDIGK